MLTQASSGVKINMRLTFNLSSVQICSKTWLDGNSNENQQQEQETRQLHETVEAKKLSISEQIEQELTRIEISSNEQKSEWLKLIWAGCQG